MLDELHVHDIALIADAALEFSPGLTVLTGETGAGKTALLTALQLICGRRADSKAVRDGASEAVAEARLVTDAEHIVRRRVSSAGRSRCTVDGEMSTVAQLARATSSVRVHGQHEQVELLTEGTQLAYLDSFADADGALRGAYRAARARWQKAQAAFDELDRGAAQAARELEFMRFTAAEIAKVSPVAGEYGQLEAELPRLQNGELIASSLADALHLMHDDGGACDRLAGAVDGLQRLSGIDSTLDALVERLTGLLAEVEDAARDLSAYAADISWDPGRLAEVMGRLDALSGLMKRYGPSMEQVLATWEEAKRAVELSGDAPVQLSEARRDLEDAEADLRAEAVRLSRARRGAAGTFCAQLADSVHELAMEDASFEFSFTELPFGRWGESGSERVELRYRPTATSSPRPLARIASGGELSRILLALECLHQQSPDAPGTGGTIVFDEVDQGVGGATGTAVAHRIASLARHVQVIVVTHLPQVAACADRHYVVSKGRDGAGGVVTTVEEVTAERRVAEVARMLAGTADETALEHARSLLADAASQR